MKRVFLVITLGILALGSAQATDTLQSDEFIVDPPTLHCLGFRWRLLRNSGDRDWLVSRRSRWLGELYLTLFGADLAVGGVHRRDEGSRRRLGRSLHTSR